MKINNLEEKASWLRRELWKMVIRQKSGHIPSSFSCVEIIVSLYYGGAAKVFRGKPEHPERDRIIVSKGHAAMVQYPVLADLGYFRKSELKKFTQPGGLLGMYADVNIPGIEAISGSLGHGVGIGSGYALAAKMDNADYKTFVVVGDGECYEGSIWESAMFASHHKLENLIVIVDCNELCILGRTKDLLDLGDLADKWRSFGWKSVCVDGHSFKELSSALSSVGQTDSQPLCIIANTVKGKGISFMEGLAEWHNRMPNQRQEAIARAELGLEREQEVDG
ncbi:MAG: transketolase [Pseudomonadota bacterium]|nr:transketolase [Pseudomonadota bacterium]